MQYNLVQFFGNISGIWTLSSTVLGIILTVVEYIFDKSKRKKMADKSKRKNMVGAFLCAITVSLAIVTFFSYWVEYHYSKVPNVIGATYDVAVQTLDEKSLICKRNDRIGVTDIVKTMSVKPGIFIKKGTHVEISVEDVILDSEEYDLYFEFEESVLYKDNEGGTQEILLTKPITLTPTKMHIKNKDYNRIYDVLDAEIKPTPISKRTSYCFSGIPEGNYEVFAEFEGYLTYTCDFQCLSKKAGVDGSQKYFSFSFSVNAVSEKQIYPFNIQVMDSEFMPLKTTYTIWFNDTDIPIQDDTNNDGFFKGSYRAKLQQYFYVKLDGAKQPFKVVVNNPGENIKLLLNKDGSVRQSSCDEIWNY